MERIIGLRVVKQLFTQTCLLDDGRINSRPGLTSCLLAETMQSDPIEDDHFFQTAQESSDYSPLSTRWRLK